MEVMANIQYCSRKGKYVMKKKSILLILSLFVMIFVGLTSKTINTYAKIGKDIGYEFVCNAVDKYYQNKDLGKTNDLSECFSSEAIPLLQAKIEMDAFQREKYGLEYKNYSIKMQPIFQEQWKDGNNDAHYLIQVIRTWGDDGDLTNMSEVLEIDLCKKGDICINRCYEQQESITYGPIDDVYKKSIESKTKKNDAKNALQKYVDNYKNECEKKAMQLKQDITNAEKMDKEIKLRANTSLNRYNIQTWARNNYYKTSPTSSSSSAPYYDFSQISGAYDCTNFVSHALLAGGATLHDNGLNGIQGTNQWYYRSTANRSSSWTGVNQLKIFLTRNKPGKSNIGPYATVKDLTFMNANTGDIVQGYNGSVWRHSTVVTAFENGQVKVTGRTSPGVYNDNQPATTIYGTQRLLHLEGNYK